MKARSILQKLLVFVPLLVFSNRTSAQYLEPVSPVNPVHGIEWYYYLTNLQTEPIGLDTMQNYTLAGTVPNFSLTPRNSNNNYTFNFRGYISVPVDTVYTFYLNSDDGSNLYIDSVHVVKNDSSHSQRERVGIVRLKAGFHKIRAYYHQIGGTQLLTVNYASDLFARTLVPDSVLYRDGIPYPEITQLPDTAMLEADTLYQTIKVRNLVGPASDLLVEAISGLQTSIPNVNLTITGTDSVRTLRIISLPNVIGPVILSVKTTGAGRQNSMSFVVSVLTRGPQMVQMPDTFLAVNGSFTNKRIYISDPDNDLSELTLTALSSNEAIVPNANIGISGTGSPRFISITPTPNVAGLALITCKVTDPLNKSAEKIFTVIVGDTNTFRASVPFLNPSPGLDYLFGEGPGGSVLDFSSQLPDSAGIVPNFNLFPNNLVQDRFGIEYKGFIWLQKSAAYTFYTNSDDGTMLYIGDSLIVSNNGNHSRRERTGIAYLKAGYHKILVQYKEANGSSALEVGYSTGLGLAKQLIPDSLLVRPSNQYPMIVATSDTVFALKQDTTIVPFTFMDADGDLAQAITKTFSYRDTIVPNLAITTNGTGASRELSFIPAENGICKVKLVIYDQQGLPAIKFFAIKVVDSLQVSNRALLRTNKAVLFPNPVKTKFRLTQTPDSEAIMIFDYLGKRMYKGSIQEVNVSAFPNGFYFVKQVSSGQTFRMLKE